MNLSVHFRRRSMRWLYHRLYGEMAWTYDAVSWLVSRGQWHAWRAAALPYIRGERVVEVGFGTGVLLQAVALEGRTVVGVDLSLQMHRLAAARLGAHGLRALQVQAPASSLPFASGVVDTLLMTFPADFILRAPTWLEIGRVLRPPDPAHGQPGGRLVAGAIVVSRPAGLLAWVDRLVPPPVHTGVDMMTRCTRLAGIARLETSIEVVEIGRARVPILLAERVLP